MKFCLTISRRLFYPNCKRIKQTILVCSKRLVSSLSTCSEIRFLINLYQYFQIKWQTSFAVRALSTNHMPLHVLKSFSLGKQLYCLAKQMWSNSLSSLLEIWIKECFQNCSKAYASCFKAVRIFMLSVRYTELYNSLKIKLFPSLKSQAKF